MAVELHDFKEFNQHGALAGLYFQAAVEQKACAIAGGTQVAPAQRRLILPKENINELIRYFLSTRLSVNRYEGSIAIFYLFGSEARL